jgi:hypothetical protein
VIPAPRWDPGHPGAGRVRCGCHPVARPAPPVRCRVRSAPACQPAPPTASRWRSRGPSPAPGLPRRGGSATPPAPAGRRYCARSAPDRSAAPAPQAHRKQQLTGHPVPVGHWTGRCTVQIGDAAPVPRSLQHPHEVISATASGWFSRNPLAQRSLASWPATWTRSFSCSCGDSSMSVPPRAQRPHTARPCSRAASARRSSKVAIASAT